MVIKSLTDTLVFWLNPISPGKLGVYGDRTMIQIDVRGVLVPALGFGTWPMRGDECRQAVEHALAIGYRHIDTAQAYKNEEAVGLAMRGSGLPRDDIFLTTKVRPTNFTRVRARASVEESLRKLGTDTIDLLLLHWPNDEVPLEETLESLSYFIDEGLVRHLGVSNFPANLVERGRAVTDIFCNQVEYHPYLSQSHLLKQARKYGHLLTAYSPIAKGRVLSDPIMVEIGSRYSKNPIQVTLRWLIQQERVAAVPKAGQPEHRLANIDIFDFELSSSEMEAIHDLSRKERLVDPVDGPEWDG
jgi:diketogulonate reductase-like aldo/keto reductase